MGVGGFTLGKLKTQLTKYYPQSPVGIEPMAQVSKSSMSPPTLTGSLYSHALLILAKSAKVQKSSGA